MKTIRAFIAVHLPREATTVLGDVSHTLAGQMPQRSVRWVQPDRMHLTLRFLGDTAVAKLPAIGAVLDQATAEFTPMTLRLGQLGCFPNRRRPRVIWAGLKGELSPLETLKRQIDEALVPLGWELEKRPFRAHLTLGRVKDGRLLRGVQWGADVADVDVPISAVYLMQSELRPSGPIYTVRHASALGKSTG